MLTHAEIYNLRQTGKLRPVNTRVPGQKEPRAMLLCEPMQQALDIGLASTDPKIIDRWEALQANFSHFVEEGFVTWKFLKWLEPKKHEVWELVSKRPRPSLRVFGRFAMPDVFVATHVVERKQLKGKWSLEFELEKIRTEEIWISLTKSSSFV
jgi:hypothetical protein